MASRPYYSVSRKRWLMKYRPDPHGGWKVATLGPHPTPTGSRRPKVAPPAIEEKAAEYRRAERDARRGIRRTETATPLGEYLDSYVAEYRADHAPGSARQAARHAGDFLAFCAARGVATVQGVTPADCREFLASRRRALSPASLHTLRNYLTPVFRQAADDGLIPASPWARAKVQGKVVRSEPAPWTAEHVEALATACKLAWHADYVRLLAAAGLRATAACSLAWTWVDWGRGAFGCIAIPDMPGNKRGYRHYLSAAAHDILAPRQANGSPWAFPSSRRPGEHATYEAVESAIGGAVRRSGIPPGSVHDLRHYYVRASLAAGVPINVVQAQVGHKSLLTTQRYSTATEDEIRRALMSRPGT